MSGSAPAAATDAMHEASKPLLVTDDQVLVDEVLRLAAAAGSAVELVPSPGAARASWRATSLVLLGDDAAEEAVRLRLPPRPGIVLVGRQTAADDKTIFERAVHVGAGQVAILPEAEQWLVNQIADATEVPGHESTTICVLGGRGGAGASTVAASLALAGMRMGLHSLLVDGDPLGGGIDLVLGGEDTAGLRWPDLANARGRVSGSALREALPCLEELTVLSWDRGDRLDLPVEAMSAVLGAAARGSDLVVVDLPRRIDEATAEALARCMVALLVVPAEVRAIASASRVAAAAASHAADLRLLVRGPAPSGLTADVAATSLGLPLAGFVRREPGIEAALDRGEPPTGRGRSPLASFCQRFLESLTDARRAA
ncbi:MAG: septum site-determining protein Ssd [Streptosporangiales bacterium]